MACARTEELGDGTRAPENDLDELTLHAHGLGMGQARVALEIAAGRRIRDGFFALLLTIVALLCALVCIGMILLVKLVRWLDD
jgi:hypothetical protein